MKNFFIILLCLAALYSSLSAQPGTHISGPVYNTGSNAWAIGAGTSAFTVAATGSYTAAPGALDSLYNGGANIEIAGTTGPLFFNAKFGTGAASVLAISNTGGATINGTLTCNYGLTTTVRANTTNGALKFGAGAGYAAALNDSRYVDGYVTKTGNTFFTFPVGQRGDVRILSMSAPATAATNIGVAWLAGNPSTTTDPSDPPGSSQHSVTAIGTGIAAVSTAGQWDWVPITAATNDLTLTAYLPDVSSFAPAANLRLVGWNGSQWINLSTASGASSASSNTKNSTLTGVVPTGTNITAIAVGSAVVSDLTPTVNLVFNAFTGTQTREFVVDLQELNGIATSSGTVQFSVVIPSGYSISFDGTKTSSTVSGLGTIAVSNANWTLISTALGGRRLTFQAKAGVLIGASGLSRIGFSTSRTATATAGSPVITVNVVDDAAATYDSNAANNIFTSIINSL